jgi:hypothetical protein
VWRVEKWWNEDLQENEKKTQRKLFFVKSGSFCSVEQQRLLADREQFIAGACAVMPKETPCS